MLTLNTKNRPFRRIRAQYFERLLRSGTFKFTHQGISFDETGKLHDGQHRLTAIARSGISAKMLVARNQPSDNQLYFDDARAGRSAIDHMYLVENVTPLTKKRFLWQTLYTLECPLDGPVYIQQKL